MPGLFYFLPRRVSLLRRSLCYGKHELEMKLYTTRRIEQL